MMKILRSSKTHFTWIVTAFYLCTLSPATAGFELIPRPQTNNPELSAPPTVPETEMIMQAPIAHITGEPQSVAQSIEIVEPEPEPQPEPQSQPIQAEPELPPHHSAGGLSVADQDALSAKARQYLLNNQKHNLSAAPAPAEPSYDASMLVETLPPLAQESGEDLPAAVEIQPDIQAETIDNTSYNHENEEVATSPAESNPSGLVVLSSDPAAAAKMLDHLTNQ